MPVSKVTTLHSQREEIKKAGLKITLPRVKILSLLENNKNRHMSAEDLYQLLTETGEDVGLTTIYRVLTQFESAGLVKRHNFEGDQAVFELNEGDHHDHIICIYCGHVDEFLDPQIEARQKEIVQQHGYQMTSHQLIIHGICHKCSKKGLKPPE